MHDGTQQTTVWRWLAILVPICRVRLVSPADDPWLVEWHKRLGLGKHGEFDDHPARFSVSVARRRAPATARPARRQGPDCSAQAAMARHGFRRHGGRGSHSYGDGVARWLGSERGAGCVAPRWPDIVVKGMEHEKPSVTMSPIDAADLGRCRRGVEPLRIVVMPQQVQRATDLAGDRADARDHLIAEAVSGPAVLQAIAHRGRGAPHKDHHYAIHRVIVGR